MKLIITSLIALLFPIPFTAQAIIKCDDNHTTFWVITNDNIDYALKLHGDIAKSKNEDLLNVEDMALQYVVLDKSKYLKKNDNDDISILVRYVSGEAEYLSTIFTDASFEIETLTGKTASGKRFLLWHYKIPENKNKEVLSQFFVNIIIGNKIFGLGAPQFMDHSPDAIKNFLIETLNTLSIVENNDSLCDN